MNRSSQAKPTSHDAILKDHKSLRNLLGKIADTFEQGTSESEAVGDLLMQLGDHVHRHFAREEKDGYFDEAVLHSPRLSAQADKLMLQHAALAADVRHLTEKANQWQPSDEWLHSTRKKFNAFHSALTEHEQKENSLLQDAYLQDLGTST